MTDRPCLYNIEAINSDVRFELVLFASGADVQMATQWYWRDGDTTNGPVSFQELAGMVRDHVLNEDDLVRPEYYPEWQTTDTVVGLYYMAQRVPIPRPEPEPEDPPVEVIAEETDILGDDFENMLAMAEELSGADESPPGPGQASDMVFPRGSLVDLIGGIPIPEAKVHPAVALLRRTQAWVVHHKIVAVAAALVIIVGGSWSAYATGRSPDAQRYVEFQQILETIRQQRMKPQPDFNPVRAQIEKIMHEVPDVLLREGAGRRHPVKQELLFVSRDLLPEILKTDLKSESVAERHMASRLFEIGQALGL